MIFPSEIRGQRNKMEPTKGSKPKTEKAYIKNWCKLTTGIKNGVKQTGLKEGLGVILSHVILTSSVVDFVVYLTMLSTFQTV